MILCDAQSLPRLAHGQKCRSVPQQSVWKAANGSSRKSRHIHPKSPHSLQNLSHPRRRSLLFFLFFFSLPLVGYEHDVAVNHVSVSRQLCQAEEECPLLARWRPVGSSEGASLGRVRRLRCGGNLFFILFFKLLLLTCSLHIFSSVRYYFRYHMSMHARDLNKSLFVQSSVF